MISGMYCGGLAPCCTAMMSDGVAPCGTVGGGGGGGGVVCCGGVVGGGGTVVWADGTATDTTANEAATSQRAAGHRDVRFCMWTGYVSAAAGRSCRSGLRTSR